MRFVNVVMLAIFFVFTLEGAVAAQPIPAKHSNRHYTKPANASEKITGTAFPYVLWYDSSKWRVEARGSNLFEKIRKGVERKGQKLNYLIVDKKMGQPIITRIPRARSILSVPQRRKFSTNAKMICLVC
jgi:hypothetical protein